MLKKQAKKKSKKKAKKKAVKRSSDDTEIVNAPVIPFEDESICEDDEEEFASVEASTLNCLTALAAIALQSQAHIGFKYGELIQSYDVSKNIFKDTMANYQHPFGEEDIEILCECIANEALMADSPEQLTEIVLARISSRN